MKDNQMFLISSTNGDPASNKTLYQKAYGSLERLQKELERETYHLEGEREEISRGIEEQKKIIQDCVERKPDFKRMARDSFELRRAINQEFKRKGIDSSAEYLCTYVSEVQPQWQDALEVYLGFNRFSLIVDKKYFQLADTVHSGMRKNRGLLAV